LLLCSVAEVMVCDHARSPASTASCGGYAEPPHLSISPETDSRRVAESKMRTSAGRPLPQEVYLRTFTCGRPGKHSRCLPFASRPPMNPPIQSRRAGRCVGLCSRTRLRTPRAVFQSLSMTLHVHPGMTPPGAADDGGRPDRLVRCGERPTKQTDRPEQLPMISHSTARPPRQTSAVGGDMRAGHPAG
jgi:hypothetical protein